MPCYVTSTISVEFDPKNLSVLQKTVDKLGWTLYQRSGHIEIQPSYGVTITIKDGQATGSSENVNKLRVGYSQTLVQYAKDWAKAKGWQPQQLSENKLILRKGK